MANQKHVKILKKGVDMWNQWRKDNPEIKPDLSRVDLCGANLREVNFSGTDLSFAFLDHANLDGANLSSAKLYLTTFANASLMASNLSGADLSGAVLSCAILVGANIRNAYFLEANLSFANFFNADLTGANFLVSALSGANFTRANLSNTGFTGVQIGWTTFGDVDFRTVKGLNKVSDNQGPFTVGIDTIARSQGDIPVTFLRGAGAPDEVITYVQFLFNNPIRYYSCFISYSDGDKEFAKFLYNDLQNKGIRCWFAPHDMKIGDKIRPRIDESIREYDKLLLILSRDSVASQWVEHEVETAIGKELEGVPNVLFPIRLDNAVMESKTGWASHIQLTRHIGDFINWKNHHEYVKAFDQLLRDLQQASTK